MVKENTARKAAKLPNGANETPEGNGGAALSRNAIAIKAAVQLADDAARAAELRPDPTVAAITPRAARRLASSRQAAARLVASLIERAAAGGLRGVDLMAEPTGGAGGSEGPQAAMVDTVAELRRLMAAAAAVRVTLSARGATVGGARLVWLCCAQDLTVRAITAAIGAKLNGRTVALVATGLDDALGAVAIGADLEVCGPVSFRRTN